MKGKAAGDSGVDSAVATWGHQSVKDFFVSYTGKDGQWAQWIAWVLEEAGYSTVIQAWDILPGNNFLEEMDRATREAERTIAVLSEAYFQSKYTGIEWQAAFRKDSQGQQRTLIPIRIQDFQVEGLLGAMVYIDLVNLGEQEAAQRILTTIGAMTTGKRGKPTTKPLFPKASSVTFPGGPQLDTLVPRTASGEGVVGAIKPVTLSRVQRLKLDRLRSELDDLEQDYQKVTAQLKVELTGPTQNKLERQLEQIAQQMEAKEQQLARLQQQDE